MKIIPGIPFLLFLILSCTANEAKISQPAPTVRQTKLTEGTYYVNSRSSDTLRFQTKNTAAGGWNSTSWRITTDSIFQADNKGFAYYMGTDQCSFILKNDTLIVHYQQKSYSRYENKLVMHKDTALTVVKYKLIKAGKGYFEVVEINGNDPLTEIRSDIQLR